MKRELEAADSGVDSNGASVVVSECSDRSEIWLRGLIKGEKGEKGRILSTAG